MSNSLYAGILGEAFQTSDEVFERLGTLGYTGTINDRMYEYLADAGHAGSVNDKMLSFFNIGSITPAQVTSTTLLAWFDAQDTGTITVDGSTNVEAWADKSGNGNNFTQTNSSHRPAYVAADAVANGFPSVAWPATTNNTLSLEGPTLDVGFMIMVMAYGDGTDATFNAFRDPYSHSSPDNRNYGVSGQGNINDSASSFAAGWTKNDGAETLAVLPLPLTVVTATEKDAASLISRIGNRNNEDRGWYGPVCEWAMFSAAPTAQEITDLKLGLYAKWGITA